MSIENEEMPLGFQMALSKNFCAMKYYSALSKHKRKQVIEKAKTMQSEEQMKQYVERLGNTYT